MYIIYWKKDRDVLTEYNKKTFSHWTKDKKMAKLFSSRMEAKAHAMTISTMWVELDQIIIEFIHPMNL